MKRAFCACLRGIIARIKYVAVDLFDEGFLRPDHFGRLRDEHVVRAGGNNKDIEIAMRKGALASIDFSNDLLSTNFLVASNRFFHESLRFLAVPRSAASAGDAKSSNSRSVYRSVSRQPPSRTSEQRGTARPDLGSGRAAV